MLPLRREEINKKGRSYQRVSTDPKVKIGTFKIHQLNLPRNMEGYHQYNLSEGMGVGVGAPTGQEAATTLPSQLALTPGQANSKTYIYYTSVTGIKLFNSSTKNIPEIFYGKSKSIYLFNEKILERENKSGWTENR